MKLASIDIGTNSTRLMIAEKNGNGLKILLRFTEITRLGEEVDKTHLIKPEAAERTLNTLLNYSELIRIEKVGSIRIAATSAMRDAQNSSDFLKKVKEETDFDVEILSGEEEAHLSFSGVTYDFRQSNFLANGERILVIDIGGGSTELIVGMPEKEEEIFSLELGCVRLTELFFKSDPPNEIEIKNLIDHIHKSVLPALKSIFKYFPVLVVGVAGTVTTLAAILQKLVVYDSQKIHRFKLKTEEVARLFQELKDKPIVERKKVIGLEPKRADVIVAGAAVLYEILKLLEVEEITVSERDILDGLIISLFS